MARTRITEAQLPPLPEPGVWCGAQDKRVNFTADQLQAYALEAVTQCQAQQEAAPAVAAQPEPAAQDKEDADMFWDHDDGDRFGHDISEIIADYGPGEIVKIDQAKRLPSVTVRVLPPKDDESDLEYEFIDDDAARAATKPQGGA